MSQLTLKCEKFGLSRGLHDLLSSGDLVDVTLACQGQFIQAHKTVLAACSPHFRSIFKMNPWQHPIVFMHDLKLTQLQALVDFMYNGEVTVEEEDLTCFLNLADALKVNGLTPQEKQDTGSWLPNYVQNDMQMTPSPSTPPPPAKIARRTHDRDVSRCDPLPVAPPAAPTNEESNSQQSWAPLTVSMTEEAMLTSDIKVEDEELRDIPAPEQNPISNSTQDCQPEEAEEEGADDSRVELDDNQEEEGPSTSSQSKKPARQRRVSGVRSRGRTTRRSLRVEERMAVTNFQQNDDSDGDEDFFINENNNAIKCKICDEIFPLFNQLMVHNKFHHSDLTLSCPKCSKMLSDIKELQKHILNMHGVILEKINGRISQCAACLEKFTCLKRKRVHTKLEHPEACFYCSVCHKVFLRTANVRRHEKLTHNC